MPRPETALGLVADHIPLPRVWRCLVCHEMVGEHAPRQERLVELRMVSERLRQWRRVVHTLRTLRVPRRRCVSWRRMLHRMDDPILLVL